MARYALVVGISQYEKPFEILTKAITDATAVAELLKRDKRYTNVEVLSGEVTTAKLGEALKTFLKQAVNNEALIYFTGHGFTVVDGFGGTTGYLATSDCSVTVKDSQIIGEAGSLPLKTLNDLIHTSYLSNLVVLLDACHSGAFLEQHLVEQSFKAFGSRTDYYLITGCRDFEQGLAKKREQHSVFTGALLGGLSQDNADEYGKVTGDRLFDFIYTELHSSKQEPIRMGIGRSIVLVEYPSKTKPVTPILDEKGEVICPYQGLQAFDREQKEFFFGRKRLVEAIKQKLDKTPFVPVIGASGSGKSSVVRAGLIPWLEEEGYWQVLEPIKPGFEPLVELRGAFKSFFKGKDEKQLKAFIEDKDKHPKGLTNIIERLPNSERFLLVVDQFEEVFTVCANEEERQRFIELIAQVTEISACRLAVVTTMRADFLEPCLRYLTLRQQIQDQAVLMPPLSGVDLKDAITEPARRQGYTLEEELLFKILEDVGKEPGFLPLLEFALTKLWEGRDQEKQLLTLEQYDKLGGLTGALNLHAEQVYYYQDFESDSPTDERDEKEKEWIKRIFLRLVRIGEQEKDTRQRQPKATLLAIAGDSPEAQEDISELLDEEEGLVQGRLLVAGKDKDGAEWIDLAHEALMGGWKRFDEWRKESRELLRLRQRLEDALREWKENPQDGNLMMGRLLGQVREQWEDLKNDLGVDAKEFFLQSDFEAILQEQIPRVQKLLPSQPLDSLVLAIKLMGLNLEKCPKRIFSSARTSLHEAMQICRLPIIFQGHKGYVYSVAFSPDGQMIVSGSTDKTLRLWDTKGQLIGQPFQGHEDYISSVAFSPDGEMIVSGSRDGTVRLWDTHGQPIGQPFRDHRDSIHSVVFSPDGKKVVSSSANNTLRLSDINGQAIGQPFEGHMGCVYSVAFSPDGEMIVSGSTDRTLRLWNTDGQPVSQPFEGHRDSIYSVAFSPNGKMIVSGSADNTVRLWDIEGNSIGQPFRGHRDIVSSVAFSPNGEKIASGSWDRTLCLWDLKGNSIVQPFKVCVGYIYSVAFSPDGEMIVSGNWDRTLCLWNLNVNSIGQPFQEHSDAVHSVAFIPNELKDCCERLGYHPIFNPPGSMEAKTAREICWKYVWSKTNSYDPDKT